MDPMAEEQLDFGDEEYGGAKKMPYHGDGAIPALVEDEMIGEEDEYDDLYNDVNVGEGSLQMQRSEASAPLPSTAAGNSGYQTQKPIIPEARVQVVPQEHSLHGVATEGKYTTTGVQLSEQKEGLMGDGGPGLGALDVSQKGKGQEIAHDAQDVSGFRGMNSVTPQTVVHLLDISEKMANDSAPVLNSSTGGLRSLPQIPANQMSTNVSINIDRSVVSENLARPDVENGTTMLFVGELHWWTTDTELESVLSQYGRVKEIKFFDERASGKSKGYCQVEFYESAAAAACKEGMNGYVFNSRACIVALASPQTIKQMAASYANKTQAPPQSHSQGRRPMNDGAGRVGGNNYPSGDTGRNYGRGGFGRGGQGMVGRGMGAGHMRGRGGAMGVKNILGNAHGMGSGPSGGAYGQALAGPAFVGPPSGLMHPQGMMGAGFDPTYMGRGAGYGGFPGPAFPGMLPPYPGVNAMGFSGVAPHVNPVFFGRGMAPNGMGMMGTSGMDGHHAAMWGDASVGGWGGEEQGQKTRESSYGGEDGASEYGYGEASHDKGARSSSASREKERGSERDWSGSYEKRYRDEREQDKDKYGRDYRHREENGNFRDHQQKDRELGYEDDWDRGHSSSRSRSRSRAMTEEDHRSRSRDAEYGKRRRPPSE